MALSILDGNQSATTLSTIVTSGQHIPAHTVVSLGTQAITNISSAISGSTVCVGNLGLLQSTVATEGLSASGSFIKIGGHAGTSTTGNIVHVSSVGALRVDGSVYTQPVSIASVTIGNTVTIAGTVTIGSALPAGTNRIGVVTIGGGTVTIGAGTAQIGSVTAFVSDLTNVTEAVDEAINQSVIAIHIKDLAGNVLGTSVSPMLISGTVTANPTGTQTIAGSVTLGAGTAQIGAVTASISNSVVTFYPLQGTTVTNSNFTSTTASTTLVSAVAGREVLTVYSEGPGQLFISPGATCTTVAYQVRLSAGDYWECPNGQLSLAHTAVFSTAGTARVTEVS